MISLFLDTSNFRLTVGIINEKDNIVKTFYNDELHGDLSVKIFEVIQECVNGAGILPTDIEKIYVITGPGSFTGVRIGVTIAKTFAWAKNKIVIPISSLETLASTPFETDYVVPMIDARRDCVYAGIYNKDLEPVISDSYISLESLKNNLPKDETCTFITDDNINYFENTSKSNIDILKIVNKHKNDSVVNPHELNPRYLKMTEAEANLLKSKSND